MLNGIYATAYNIAPTVDDDDNDGNDMVKQIF